MSNAHTSQTRSFSVR